ncbi:hypothetical protein PENTCL1PPCAC_14610, partial [Pristionchus entomophagus]
MAGQTLLLAWVDSYYPVIYQDVHTEKIKGWSITFFRLLPDYLRDVHFEYVHYDNYQADMNRTMWDSGRA